MREDIVTLAMYDFDGVRIRMPMLCAVVAAFVLLSALLLGVASWIVDTKGASASNSAQTSSADASDAPDPARLLEDRGRPGRRF
ncbi:hypothetical protein [Polyangium sp. 6x1]|uniref:hypothetical protein n=1 Tax=Polyangium sp. 6x1 TaxID=3042689 RepID=UPI002482D82B|nr:hypothetical protein [Polyangium sp. 6x1]MDI1447343.1 hypothetical protein [Polyangium sp. 6x1]